MAERIELSRPRLGAQILANLAERKEMPEIIYKTSGYSLTMQELEIYGLVKNGKLTEKGRKLYQEERAKVAETRKLLGV